MMKTMPNKEIVYDRTIWVYMVQPFHQIIQYNQVGRDDSYLWIGDDGYLNIQSRSSWTNGREFDTTCLAAGTFIFYTDDAQKAQEWEKWLVVNIEGEKQALRDMIYSAVHEALHGPLTYHTGSDPISVKTGKR